MQPFRQAAGTLMRRRVAVPLPASRPPAAWTVPRRELRGSASARNEGQGDRLYGSVKGQEEENGSRLDDVHVKESNATLREDQAGLQSESSSAEIGGEETLSTANRSETNTEEAAQPAFGTYLDQLFDSPDAFTRDEDAEPIRPRNGHKRSGTSTSSTIDRSVLDGPAFRRAARQLNQEWDLPDRSEGRRPSGAGESSSSSGGGGRTSGPEYRGSMTPSEIAVFDQIFSSVWQSDVALGTKPRVYEDDGLFGSSVGSREDQQLRSFFSRTVSQKARMRAGLSGSLGPSARQAHPRSNAIAMVRELLAAEGIDEAKVEEGVDMARVQLQSCQMQSEVWEWAKLNVWPAEAEEIARAQDEATVGEPDAQTPPSADRTFGVTTPYYAPVLHMMFKELRDRFRAPHTALAVLRTARNLGPESLVLGCTPQLYAEAIRTCWNVLSDLQGARDLVKEAKDTGILSGSFNPTMHRQIMRKHASNEAQEEELDNLQDESLINRIVDNIKQDVQRNVYRAQQAMPPTAASHLLNHQLELVEEMSRIVAPRGDDLAARFSPAARSNNNNARQRTVTTKRGRSTPSHRRRSNPLLYSDRTDSRYSPSVRGRNASPLRVMLD